MDFRNLNPGENSIEQNISREEYMEKLNKWLNDARIWHGICSGLPYFYTNYQYNTSNTEWYANSELRRRQPFILQREQQNAAEFNGGVRQFVIPPLWKRFVAEMLDFFILLVIKLTLSFLVLETFNLISLDYYGIDTFQKNLKNPKIAMQISVELLTLEIFHKLIVCVYEAYFLKGGMCSTPGKRYMGLMVIHVEEVRVPAGQIDDTIVTVTSRGPLGIKNSIIRAVLKNLFIGLMLPVCSLYVFRHNRTGYDMMANSIVVEMHPQPDL